MDTNFEKLLATVSKKIENGNFTRKSREISEVFSALVEENKGKAKGKKRGMSASECGVVGNLYKDMAIIAALQAKETKDLEVAKAASGLNQRATYWFNERRLKVEFAKKLDSEGKYTPRELSEKSKEALLNGYLSHI